LTTYYRGLDTTSPTSNSDVSLQEPSNLLVGQLHRRPAVRDPGLRAQPRRGSPRSLRNHGRDRPGQATLRGGRRGNLPSIPGNGRQEDGEGTPSGQEELGADHDWCHPSREDHRAASGGKGHTRERHPCRLLQRLLRGFDVRLHGRQGYVSLRRHVQDSWRLHPDNRAGMRRACSHSVIPQLPRRLGKPRVLC
jgi:hypothetical protein